MLNLITNSSDKCSLGDAGKQSQKYQNRPSTWDDDLAQKNKRIFYPFIKANGILILNKSYYSFKEKLDLVLLDHHVRNLQKT